MKNTSIMFRHSYSTFRQKGSLTMHLLQAKSNNKVKRHKLQNSQTIQLKNTKAFYWSRKFKNLYWENSTVYNLAIWQL